MPISGGTGVQIARVINGTFKVQPSAYASMSPPLGEDWLITHISPQQEGSYSPNIMFRNGAKYIICRAAVKDRDFNALPINANYPIYVYLSSGDSSVALDIHYSGYRTYPLE